MARTYTDTPEPRYVERAKESETTSVLPKPATGDAGKVLKVGEDLSYELEEGGGGGGADVPEPTVADAGKVLGVDDEGKYALVEGGGGGAALKFIGYGDGYFRIIGIPSNITTVSAMAEFLDHIANIITPMLKEFPGTPFPVYQAVTTSYWFINMTTTATGIASIADVSVDELFYYDDESNAVHLTSDDANRPAVTAYIDTAYTDERFFDAITGRELFTSTSPEQ